MVILYFNYLECYTGLPSVVAERHAVLFFSDIDLIGCPVMEEFINAVANIPQNHNT